MSYSCNALHFWNREEICYEFHVYNFHFCWDLNKLQLVWLEVEDEVIRARSVSYIYCFAYVNECIATPVVEARACNLWDLGSSPSGTLSIFHTFLYSDFLFFAGRWASLGPFYFYFYWLTPCSIYTPLAQFILFSYFYFILFS